MTAIITTNVSKNTIDLDEISRYFQNKKYRVFPFQKSHVGSSGLTYLPLDLNFRWVIKWQNRHQAEIEYLCSEFYRRSFSDISVPSMILDMPEKLRKDLQFFFKEVSIADFHIPMLIEYKNGYNLSSLCRSEKFFALPLKELRLLFRTFGEIAGYDFLIANCDRFIPSDFRGNINQKHSANGGNILIELKVPDTMEDSIPGLASIYSIDNCPRYQSFFDSSELKEHTLDSDSFELDLYTGLGIDQMWDDIISLPTNKADPTEKNDPASTYTSSSSSFKGVELRRQRYEDFEYFMRASTQEVNLLTEQIILGIINLIKEQNPAQVTEINVFFEEQEIYNAIREDIFKGLISARDKFSNLKLLSIIGQLKQESQDYLPTGLIALDFIQQNLKLAQNGNSN